jgi:hypothetical protein
MANNRINDTFESLYDKVRGDNDDFMDENAFKSKLYELIEIDLIETSTLDDSLLYSARQGLEWADFVEIDDPVKKSILLLLSNNPKTFAVLLNTQKGKMRIAALEMKKWSEDTTKRTIGLIVVDNDKTLADQSAEGIKRVFGELNVELIMFSSNSKTTIQDAITKIDAYEFNPDDYPMPVICFLANKIQIEKMIKTMQHIYRKITNRNSLLRYGVVWDEADKIYPPFRTTNFHIGGENVSVKKYIIDSNNGLYRLGFVTATDGDLLDQDYPECANAHLYPVVIDPEDEQHYRALHHPEAITHRVKVKSKHSNNSYAKEIISDNMQHFTTPITLPSGEIYYKKIIINSNSKTSDMNEFARWSNNQGMYALVFNGYSGASVKVHRSGMPVKSFKTKGKNFNQVLYYIYKKLHLNDKPLVIIGRRKVDRGLGFHYAPRTNDEITIDGEEGILISQNREGLIWTDMILGKIDDKNIAVQKAGRLAGIIGNSPQYSGSIHYWTDENTEDLIRRHNTVVDVANTYSGCSVLQAVKHAEDTTPVRKVNHRVESNRFLVYRDEATVISACRLLNYSYRRAPTNEDGFMHTSINDTSHRASLFEAIEGVNGGYGTQTRDREGEDVSQRSQKYVKIKRGDHNGKFGFLTQRLENNKYNVNINGQILAFERKDFSLITYRTFYPCYKNIDDASTLHYVIIIRPGDESKVQEIKNQYPSIEVPQEGDF